MHAVYRSNLQPFCEGGDLDTLLWEQPGHRFPLDVAQFYTAEIVRVVFHIQLLLIIFVGMGDVSASSCQILAP